MPDSIPASERAGMPDATQVERAIRLSYVQMMLNAVFAASTGGMFLIGFAMDLGAGDILLGLVATVPQYFVVSQFLAAYFIERGVSRKRITLLFSFIMPLCWFLVAAIPFFADRLTPPARFAVLISVIALVTLSGQVAENARGSWVGDLIPADRRGRFFGYGLLFAGIVGAVFAVAEGRFLDFIRSRGLVAFTALFFFGAVFGAAAASLHAPQPDCPLPGGRNRLPFRSLLREALRNRPFMTLALVHAVLGLSSIAGPFGTAYCLRDLRMSFFGLGLLNSIGTISMLVFSPLWGRIVDRFGGRPVLILGLSILAPLGGIWFFLPPGAAHKAYMLLPWTNFLAGIGSAALNVSISTLIYKMSKPEGRSVQFALYGALIALVSAPMPLLGGWMVSRLQEAGCPVDVRLTCYLWSVFILAAALTARILREPGSVPAPALVFEHIPDRIARFYGGVASSVWPFFSSLVQFPFFPPKRDRDRPPEKDSPEP